MMSIACWSGGANRHDNLTAAIREVLSGPAAGVALAPRGTAAGQNIRYDRGKLQRGPRRREREQEHAGATGASEPAMGADELALGVGLRFAAGALYSNKTPWREGPNV